MTSQPLTFTPDDLVLHRFCGRTNCDDSTCWPEGDDGGLEPPAHNAPPRRCAEKRWSLHPPGSTRDAIRWDDAPCLLSGEGEPTEADYEEAFRIWCAETPPPASLEDLRRYLTSGVTWPTAPLHGGDVDWAALPTFGGEPPADAYEVWSWDETRLLVGADLDIIPRHSPDCPFAVGDRVTMDGREGTVVDTRYAGSVVVRWGSGDCTYTDVDLLRPLN